VVDGHEKRCSGRLVTCPGYMQGGCRFNDMPIKILADHMNQCIYVSKVSSKSDVKHTSDVRDNIFNN
jgi:hypothetical protein